MIFGNLLCAITVTYAMRFITSTQTVMITWCWIPFCIWMLNTGHPVIAAVGFYMAVSGGYWPLIIYSLPFILLAANMEFLVCATLICLPQVVVTMLHMQKSVRQKATKKSKAIGSVPPWHFISYLFPLRLSLNGVPYPELSYGIGRIAFGLAVYSIMTTPDLLYLGLVGIGLFLAMGRYVCAPVCLRVPARATWMVSIALCYLMKDILPSLEYHLYVILLLIQSWDILANHVDLVLYHPFMEKADKPSALFNTPLTRFLWGLDGRVSNLPWPLASGHITGVRGLGYCGGSMLLDDAEYRGITNMNGDTDGQDWFANATDGIKLDQHDIRYAYRPPLNMLIPYKWKKTEVPDLWENAWSTQRT